MEYERKTMGVTDATGSSDTPLSYIDRRINDALNEVQRLRELKQALAFTEYEHQARNAVYRLLVEAESNRDRPPFRY